MVCILMQLFANSHVSFTGQVYRARHLYVTILKDIVGLILEVAIVLRDTSKGP